MTTIDYKEKYEQALEKARQLCAYPTTKPFMSDLQDLFPELVESEDERIRKALIKYYSFNKDGGSHALDNITPEQILAWLEKQGEKRINGNKKEIPNSAWSKEDEKNYQILQKIIYDSDITAKTANKLSDWLKSLKERYTWKPSDRDIKLLKELSDGKICPDNYRARLYEIINNLKNL